MTDRDHTSYREEIGAYLLGALTDLERQAFEQHLARCAECRAEIEELRPAADALPRSVEQVEPPPGLKTSLMEIVEREARGAAAGEGEQWSAPPARPRPPLRERLRLPALRPAFAMAALVVGLVAGFGVAQLGGDDGGRTVVATVDQSRIPQGSGNLRVEGEGDDGAILRVSGMPELDGEQVYQAWVQRGGMIIPQPTFEVGPDGSGAVAVPEDLSDAAAVLVTREQRGGASAPSEEPILSVPL
jgi:anti-sigma-K factor RskA/putative zinc finger protein